MTKILKSLVFISQAGGRPDSRITTGKHRGQGAKWNEEHMFWQYHERLERNVFAIMWYFPKCFTGYCTAFNWHGKKPAGGIYITIDNAESTVNDWCETHYVESMDAVKSALSIIRQRYKEKYKRKI